MKLTGNNKLKITLIWYHTWVCIGLKFLLEFHLRWAIHTLDPDILKTIEEEGKFVKHLTPTLSFMPLNIGEVKSASRFDGQFRLGIKFRSWKWQRKRWNPRCSTSTKSSCMPLEGKFRFRINRYVWCLIYNHKIISPNNKRFHEFCLFLLLIFYDKYGLSIYLNV